ncbi:hypothetical protein BU15DRAFT_90269 [Melanogaster broomeanus]|nr:hypothetical protein BU15DRAFT_90269 [Melanogaster broomeanus]
MITLPSNVIPKLLISPAFLASFFALVLLFRLSAPYCTTIKQRSWVLTTLSSGVMSLCSLPLFWEYARASGDLKNVSTSTLYTDTASRFFQAYLIADVTMGVLYYRSKVNWLTGWVHHTIYVFVVEYAVRMNWSHIFCLCAIMEIPTFVLAVASIDTRMRSDALFAVSFFITRIVLHAVIAVSLVVQRQDVTGGSLGPGVIMACIFPLHAHWFSGSVKSFIKRAKTQRRVSGPKVVNPAPSPDRPGTPTLSSPVSYASSHASRSSILSRRRASLRARWDQLGLWKAGGRLNDVQRRVRAVLPARERVYEYVGWENRRGIVTLTPVTLVLDNDGVDGAD